MDILIHIHSEHILVHVHNIRHTEDKDQLQDWLQVQQQVQLQQIFSFCPNIPNVHMNKDIHIHSEHILVHVHNIHHKEDKDQLQGQPWDQQQVQLQQISSFCPNIPNVHMNKDIHPHSEHILVHVHNIRHTEDKDQLRDQP